MLRKVNLVASTRLIGHADYHNWYRYAALQSVAAGDDTPIVGGSCVLGTTWALGTHVTQLSANGIFATSRWILENVQGRGLCYSSQTGWCGNGDDRSEYRGYMYTLWQDQQNNQQSLSTRIRWVMCIFPIIIITKMKVVIKIGTW